MKEEPPKILWKRKVIYNSGSYRISLPIEIADAFNIKKGQMLQLSVEGKRIIVELIE
ncbi:MAG: AbrB/MazE/SpoVT family DNA-binding domain-containing protein [Candidatus Heimdallarchaeota archaeon]